MSKSLLIKNLALGLSIFFLAFAVLCFVRPEPVFADSKYITYDIGYVNTHTTQYTDFQTLLYNAIDQGLQQYSFISSSTSALVASAVESKMYDFGLVDHSFSSWDPEDPDFYCNATFVVSNQSLANHKYLVLTFYPTSGYCDVSNATWLNTAEYYFNVPGLYMTSYDGFLLTNGHSFYNDTTSPVHQSFWIPGYIRRYSNSYNLLFSNSSSSDINSTNRTYLIPSSDVVGTFPYGGSFSSELGLYTFGFDSSSYDDQLYTSFDYQMSFTNGNGICEFCFDLGTGSSFTLPASGQAFGHFSYGSFYPVYTGRDYDTDTDHTGTGIGHYPVFNFGYTYSGLDYSFSYNAGSTFSSGNGRDVKLYIFRSSGKLFTSLDDIALFFTGSPGYHEAFRVSDFAPGLPTPTPVPSYAYATPTPFPTYIVSATVTPIGLSSNPNLDIDTGSLFGDIKGYIDVFSEFLDGSVFVWTRNIFQRFVTFGSDPIFSVLVFLPVIGLIAFILGRLLFK